MLKVLITGCRGGIGFEAATKLLKAGHFVYVTVHREESLPEVKEKLKQFSTNVMVEKLDITLKEDREKILDWDLDVLVNNASLGDSGPLIEIDMNRVRTVLETNIFSTLELTQIAVKKMIENKKGRVVIIGSLYGMLPTPFLAPYGMGKFALENIAYSLRSELKCFGIPVVIVNPGAYNTGFNLKNIKKKYEWLNEKGLYKDHIDVIKKSEKDLLRFEHQNTDAISDKVVKAVTAKKPKRRYVAPLLQYMLVPVAKRFT